MMMMKFMRKVSFLLVVSFDNGTGTRYLVPVSLVFGAVSFWRETTSNNKQQHQQWMMLQRPMTSMYSKVYQYQVLDAHAVRSVLRVTLTV